MKTIEKGAQTFEIVESKAEAMRDLKEILWDVYSYPCGSYKKYGERDVDGTWNDEDGCLSVTLDDGTYFHFHSTGSSVRYGHYSKKDWWEGISEEPLPYLPLTRVVKYLYTNSGTERFFGDVEIVYNEHYEDWETDYKD